MKTLALTGFKALLWWWVFLSVGLMVVAIVGLPLWLLLWGLWRVVT